LIPRFCQTSTSLADKRAMNIPSLEGLLSRLSDEAIIALYDRAEIRIAEGAFEEFIVTVSTAHACTGELKRRGKLHLLAK
jgi:hypothetical protein